MHMFLMRRDDLYSCTTSVAGTRRTTSVAGTRREVVAGRQPMSIDQGKKEEGKTVFSNHKYMYFYYKRGKIHLMTWFAREQCFKA
jgi:hypothetical protein